MEKIKLIARRCLIFILLSVGFSSAYGLRVIGQPAFLYLPLAGSIAAAGVGVWAKRPRPIGLVRSARDGTTFQDFDDGNTLIQRANGCWSYVRTKRG